MQIPFDNSLLHQDLVEEFKWELSVLYPFAAPQDLVIQYVEVDKNNLTDFNTAIVAAMPRKILQLVDSFCKENNLKLKFVDNIHIASERALAASSPIMDKGLALSIYLGNKYLSIIFSLNGKPVRLKIIPLNYAGEIPALIQKEISPSETFRINKNMIDACFITGEGLSSSLVDTLRKNTKLEFIYFNPFEKIKPAPKLFDNKNISDKANSFSSAAGIAFRLA
jgi:Tfp pilus assembly PilM family ATPase